MPAARNGRGDPVPAPSPFDAANRSGSAGGSGPGTVEVRHVNVHTDRTRYFVITSHTQDNVVKSLRHSLWATQRKNEQRFDEAFRTAPAVILVFSVQRSEQFLGYAIMRSPIGKPRSRDRDPFNGFGRLFDIEWLRLHDLPYQEVANLRNSLNGDRPITFSRDGQELSNEAGHRLCALIDRHIDDPDSFPPPAQPEARAKPSSPPRMLPPPDDPAGVPPGTSPFEAGGASRARSRSGSGSDGHRKRRRRERKYRNAPNPLEATFDEQLKFFLTLDFEDYASWWKRCGARDPGPVLPQPTEYGPPPSAMPGYQIGAPPPPPPHGYMAPPPPQPDGPWTPPPHMAAPHMAPPSHVAAPYMGAWTPPPHMMAPPMR